MHTVGRQGIEGESWTIQGSANVHRMTQDVSDRGGGRKGGRRLSVAHQGGMVEGQH